ncbi:MAG: SUMF1/EgtB/PvdO family nonheme iron enzyme [Cytophagales bacterium]|nr:SUMF1/EgtB/PvdO family nonheme iron enzyme [Cytophagales bacterium]
MMRPINLILPILSFIVLQSLGQTITAPVPEMVFVKGGAFQMGCSEEQIGQCVSDELPITQVTLFDYWMGKYEVTNSEYAAFLSSEGNQVEGGERWYKIDKYALIVATKDGTFKAKPGYERYPVSNVTWYGAQAYTKWLSLITNQNYRLPTEAEWEYAARAGQKSSSYVYSGSNTAEEVSYSFENADESKTGWGFKRDVGSHPVGSKSPNELGIFDMSGNVKEWCSDAYEYKLQGGVNPTGPVNGSYRILRGGSWDNKATAGRVSARSSAQLIGAFPVSKGFRVIMDVDLSEKIETFAKEKNFSGVIRVTHKNRTLYHGSFGWADVENMIHHQDQTPFAIASISKLFTAIIILQLAEERKLYLNKTIGQYLPEYLGPARDSVYIHQLLNHTSGIKRPETIFPEKNDIPLMFLDSLSSDDLFTKYCQGSLEVKPGTLFNYSNGDYIILGKIIEQIEDEAYEKVLARRILDPLGLSNTGLITYSTSSKRFPQGYTWKEETQDLKRDRNIQIANYFTGGAMYSNAADLATFSDALFRKNALLNDQSMDQLLRTYPETRSYGYGLWVRYQQHDRTVIKVTERYGRIWGVNTLLSHVLDFDINIVVLANTNRVNPASVQNFVLEQLIR